jgi:hypothetical protein
VVTGNHYWFDAIVAVALLGPALLAVRRPRRAGTHAPAPSNVVAVAGGAAEPRPVVVTIAKVQAASLPADVS